MAIITIARECGAHGRIITEKLSETLGVRYIDKSVVDTRLEALGISAKSREAFDERKPGFFAALTDAVERYVNCLKLVLYDEAKDGNCIILGRGAQMMFRNVPGSINVRLIAPLECRIERIAQREGVDASQARQIIEKTDHNRAGFNNFFFDCEWENPLNYDIVYNTGVLSDETIIGQIANLAKNMKDDVKAEGLKTLNNLTLAQRVEREILYIKKIPVFFLNVTCEGDQVTLKGIVHSSDAIEKAHDAAFIDGVNHVDCKLQIGLHGQFRTQHM